MKKVDKLLPIYREQKEYTIFYDHEHEKFYTFQHQEIYPFFILILHSLVIPAGIYLANEIFLYYAFTATGLRMLLLSCISIVVIVSYFVAKLYYRNFYTIEARELFLHRDHIEKYARLGIEQYRKAIYVGGTLSILFAVVPFLLTLVFARLEFLVLGGLGITSTFNVLFSKPFTTKKILEHFLHKEPKVSLNFLH